MKTLTKAPMKHRMTYSEEALGHLGRLSDFLVRQVGVEKAQVIIDELLDKLCTLEEMPYLGHEHPDALLAGRGYRAYKAGRYVAVYLVTESGVWIAGVYHTKTDWLTTP